MHIVQALFELGALGKRKPMSTKFIFAMGMLAAFTLSMPARALPITDVVNPTDTYIVAGDTPSPCPSDFSCGSGWLRFTHRITDDGFNIGDAITNASLVIHLTEVWTTGVNQEQFQFDIGAQTASCLHGNCVPNSGLTKTIELTSGSLLDLAADGVLEITITALDGGFYFADSLLTVETTPRSETLTNALTDTDGLTDPLTRSSVPVPSTLLLLGAGVVAAGAGRLRGKPAA